MPEKPHPRILIQQASRNKSPLPRQFPFNSRDFRFFPLFSKNLVRRETHPGIHSYQPAAVAGKKEKQACPFGRFEMKAIASIIVALAFAMFIELDTASAQYSGQSSSWSSSYSSSWGSSWGYGPNGYYNSGYQNESAQSTYTNSNYGYDPYYGGYNAGNTYTQGYQQSSGYSNGYNNGYGTYVNTYNSYHQYANGSSRVDWR
jgi:hypothetical protein